MSLPEKGNECFGSCSSETWSTNYVDDVRNLFLLGWNRLAERIDAKSELLCNFLFGTELYVRWTTIWTAKSKCPNKIAMTFISSKMFCCIIHTVTYFVDASLNTFCWSALFNYEVMHNSPAQCSVMSCTWRQVSPIFRQQSVCSCVLISWVFAVFRHLSSSTLILLKLDFYWIVFPFMALAIFA